MTSGLYLEVTLFYFIKEGLLKSGLYLQGGLYSEVAFNTGLTVQKKGTPKESPTTKLQMLHPSTTPSTDLSRIQHLNMVIVYLEL